MKNEDLCPCKSGKTFGACCAPVIAGEKKAETAEILMRARYSAYATGAVKFLHDSSGPEVRAEFDEKATRQWSESATWEGLDVLDTEKGTASDDEGWVSFIARYTVDDRLCEHRERSYFKRIDGEWRFIDGLVDTGEPYRREEPKINRNAPCPCGSGKKYKKCCGKNA